MVLLLETTEFPSVPFSYEVLTSVGERVKEENFFTQVNTYLDFLGLWFLAGLFDFSKSSIELLDFRVKFFNLGKNKD